MPARFDLVAPRADALMESLRATGYSLPDAVSDIIDNSITAGGRNIWLNFHWAGADSWVSILDDGRGMSESGLIDAMRIGSRSPREVREPSDLGTLRPWPQDSINLPGQVPDRCNACLEAEGDEHPAMGPGPPRIHRRLATPECPGRCGCR